RSARSPVEQLRGVHDRNAGARELHDAADVARRDDVRTGAADVRELQLAKLCGNLRLQDVVSTRRAAAEMPLGNVAHVEAGALEQPPRNRVDALPMLHRA